MPCRPFVFSAVTPALRPCVLCALQLQDQALGEGLLGTETARVPALSPRREHIGQTDVDPAMPSFCVPALLSALHLQDQALAVGEGLLGTNSAPVPALSPWCQTYHPDCCIPFSALTLPPCIAVRFTSTGPGPGCRRGSVGHRVSPCASTQPLTTPHRRDCCSPCNALTLPPCIAVRFTLTGPGPGCWRGSLGH